MKKLLRLKNQAALIALMVFSLASTTAFAQKVDTAKIIASNEILRKNAFKFNATSLLMKSYNFTYERLLTRKISFVAGYNTMAKNSLSDLPIVKNITKRVFDEGDDIQQDLDKIVVSNNAYTAEFRFYGGSKSGARGFYLSVYGRYANTKINYNYEYEAANAQTYNLPIQSSLKGIGGGLMIGVQQLIAKRVAVDFYILGAHYGQLTGDANAVTDLSALSPTDKQDLKEEIDNLVTNGDKKYINSTVTDNGVSGKVKGPFVGLRFGINLGIAF